MARATLIFLAMILGAHEAVAESRILRPDPADFSQISPFRADWCAPPSASLTVDRVCFGRAAFQGKIGIRSVLVHRKGGGDELYLESEWPAVELLKPKFGLLGPVNVPGKLASELGECSLSFGREGEVIALSLWSPSLSGVQAVRR